MKLYLSSYRIPDVRQFCEFVGKEPSDIKFGLVLNAKDNRDPEYRKEKLNELLAYFSDLGFVVEEIDLRKYTGTHSVQEKLLQFNVVWFNGGNTYMLRQAIRRSGVEEVLLNVLNQGVVYAGDSAGAIVVGPTLKYFNGADDPSVAEDIIYEGLHIVDFSALPHWGSEEYGHVLEDIEKNLREDSYKTLRMTDDQFVMVEDGKVLPLKKS